MSFTGHSRRAPGARAGVWVALAVAFAAVVALFLLGSWAASAQEVGQTVDLRPAAMAVVEWLGALALTVASAAGALAVRWISMRTGLDHSMLEREYNARLNDIIHSGINFAIAAARTEVAKPDSPINKVELNNWFLTAAATYVNQAAPQLLAHFSITPERLQELILARMPGYFGEVHPLGGASPTLTTERVGEAMGIPAAPATSGQPAPVVLPATSDSTAATG
jgi:hypothetical protein